MNSVATREKYLRILIHRLGLGMQPLWAWMAWMRAISVAMSLMTDTKKKLKYKRKKDQTEGDVNDANRYEKDIS